ncbi:hypothetical protein HHI36_019772 [Cryptolaemus montrouzieri]|uniref:Uncharacterized protein n=1 Tax=Cryptolaemus montrouzieri TaxID=559131 RepID=A0ABD2N9I1_9CUCU
MFWFCDECVPVVKQKLAPISDEPTSDVKSINLSRDISVLVDKAVSFKLGLIENQNEALISELRDQYDSVKGEIENLRQSNIEMIRLLESENFGGFPI